MDFNHEKITVNSYSSITFVLLIFCWVPVKVTGQITAAANGNITDSIHPKSTDYFRRQKDLIDLTYLLLHKNSETRLDSKGKISTRLYFSFAPVVEYTTATGFSPGIAGNVAFMTGVAQQTNNSFILGAIKYTQKNQFLLPVQTSIWAPGNRYNFLGDWRYPKYPQDAFGLGGHANETDKYTIDYKYLRLYEFVLKRITRNLYAGVGYQLDDHWAISELDVKPGRITDFEKYGSTGNKFETGLPAAGIGLRIKFNTFSGTNACIDYGIGGKGSRGFVGNLGEVF